MLKFQHTTYSRIPLSSHKSLAYANTVIDFVCVHSRNEPSHHVHSLHTHTNHHKQFRRFSCNRIGSARLIRITELRVCVCSFTRYYHYLKYTHGVRTRHICESNGNHNTSLITTHFLLSKKDIHLTNLKRGEANMLV